MNHPHLNYPAQALYRLLAACLIGTAAFFLSACATTDTADTATPTRQHFFSPSDGTYFGTSLPWTEDDMVEVTAKAEHGDAAAQYELGLVFLARGEQNDKAFDLMKKAAEQGDARAEVYLGTMYRNGQGVKKDRDEAIRRYHIAIDKGSAWAMFEMGSLLFENPGRDTQKTLEWFRKAADAGYPMAQTAYGIFLLEGKDLPKDAVNGERYMKTAAESGDAFSEFSLGILYARGMHFEENLDIAEVWINKSAEKHYVPAQYTLEWLKRRKAQSAMKTGNSPGKP